MRMRDGVGMRTAVVRVREGVRVQMGVIAFQRVDHDQRRAADHHNQRGEIQP